jgi:hypothetical protein
MQKTDLLQLTDEELLAKKKKLKNDKIFSAVLIGFLGGVLLFGFGAWILSPQKQLGFLIPMLFPIWFISRLLKNNQTNKDLEAVLQERGLN